MCSICGCKGYKQLTQKSTCGNEFEIQYIRSGKYLLPQKERDKNYFLIYFESHFNDKIKIKVNQNEIFNKQVITNDKRPDDYSDRIMYKMDGKNEYIMDIQGIDSNTCLNLTLDKKYRVMYFFYYQNKWIVRFSNELRIN
ncbi:hypothetical protein C1631_006490 [Chryseobacterium phosphatilyticum]|uniref:Uncharacterized protein n=2 Tax=Chryseobacterium phosphatilyticum TaxID=475075 RepID=A0A316XJ66_9FLAO|nr:hypothetical protein C1631_006490 [Chryseobacterium phosphatilyticum]